MAAWQEAGDCLSAMMQHIQTGDSVEFHTANFDIIRTGFGKQNTRRTTIVITLLFGADGCILREIEWHGMGHSGRRAMIGRLHDMLGHCNE